MDDKTARGRPNWSTDTGTAATLTHTLGLEEVPALSYSQQQLWLAGHSSSSPSHHVAARLRLRGKLDRQALRRALDLIVARHESLRTTFPSIEGEPTRVCVRPDAGFLLVEEEVESQVATVEQISRQEAFDPFDLSAGPLIRGRLLQPAENEHVLLITQHRLISDSSSTSVLLRELGTLYSAFTFGRSNPLPPLDLQYVDYASWERQHITIDVLNDQLEFWKRTLTGSPTLTQVPADRPRGSLRHSASDRVRLKFSTALAKRLVQFARQERVSLFVTLLSGWAVLLGRWCGQVEIVIGTRVTRRQRTETATLIGPFENTLALRICMEQDPTVEQVLKHVKAVVADAYARQDVPLDKILDTLDPIRGRNPPTPQLNVAMNDTDAMNSFDVQLAGLKVTEVSVVSTEAQFELSLSMSDGKEGLTATFEYASDLFERETVERMSACWETLLKGMVKHPRRPISRIAMLPATERERVLYRFNQPTTLVNCENLIHRLFEEQAERTPDLTAVTYEDQSLTYAELNARANQLARYLREKGVSADQLVGICVERSLEMIVGLLAILKAGAAYVPLDPNYPAERLAYMLQDAAPLVVLTQERLRAVLPASPAELMELDGKWNEIAKYPQRNLSARELELSAQNRVYVIYTSGSTGRPKGTEMTHRSMVNLIEWHRESFPASEGTRVLQFAALSFDVAFQETFTTLCTGGTLVLLDEWVRRDVRALLHLLSRRSIRRLFVPPLMLQALAEFAKSTGMFPPDLQDVITAGEQLRISAEIIGFFKHLDGCRLHNHYGPTESHVVTALTLTGDPDKWPVLPAIGRPIANTQIYILDGQWQPVPIGVTGEIYIGGANVARGYLNRPELTAQRFVADPFSAHPEARLYKTGDLGRWRSDGALEYLGRNDDQVKIRGFRIELGEIEAQLARHDQVKEAAVVAREDVPGDKRLVAYVTPRTGNNPSPEELRTLLKAALPDHMVPSAFLVLERLPLTPSGKLDRRALPAPDQEAYVSRQYEAPRDEIEEILAGVWQELLRVERVGRHDNFFELGGDSLVIAQMMERLRRIGLSGEVRHFFQSRSLAELASALTSEGDEVGALEAPPNLIPPACEAITPQMLPLVELDPKQIERIALAVPGGMANIQDIYPLAPLQEGLLFHHLLNEQGGDTYVIPTLLSVSSRRRLEELIAALQSVVDRHDALRTAVLWEELPRAVQVVYRRAILPVKELVLDRSRELTEQVKEWMTLERQQLELRQAPLLRLTLAEDPRVDQWYVLLQLHHIVGDDTTQEIIGSEVNAHLKGSAERLPESLPYRNHVAHVLAHARARAAEEFFRSKLAAIDEPTAPFGLLDVHRDGSRIEESRQVLEPAFAKRVRTHARRLGISAATLFHAAWSLVVARTSARDDVVFGSVLLGRLQGNSAAQRMAGMFINTLPLRLRLQNVTAKELVEQTQRELVELLSHEQASLAAAQRCSGIVGSDALFTALLNYRHGMRGLGAEWIGAEGIRVLAHHDRTNYPIALSVDDLGEGFALTARTDRAIDPDRLMGYMRAAMHSLLEALDQAPQTPALTLAILPESERCQVIKLFNATQAAYPKEKLIHELFEEQVQRTPGGVAVMYEGQSLTYLELNSRANQLARCLRERGVGPNQLVGICVERSLEMVVGLLGILKAGGAYVPLDPGYPSARLAYILKDAAPRVVLTQEPLRERLPDSASEFIPLDSEWNEISKNPTRNLELRAAGLHSHDLAYVIYTSGSTGQPKGVMIEHRNVMSLWQGLDHIYRQSASCRRIAVNASFNFDASVKQLIQLLSGRTIAIIPAQVRADPSMLLRFIEANQIDGIDCTPSQLKSWVSAGLLLSRGHTLRLALVGGEPIEAELWNRLAQCSGADFYNVYGPTESTVDTTFAHIERDTTPHIGRPMENRRVHILDPRGEPLPIGVPGEMYIGGEGVARGYLNRAELTTERFIADPFSTDQHARLYKTGDLGRWRADGTLEYLGRNDDQIKIRGHRIELGEIETQLARHEHVKDAVVVARQDDSGEKRLVAYIKTYDRGGPSVEDLRTYLSAVLPEYMVPSAFVTLERFPLTPNGKLDRRALPLPDFWAYSSRRYEAPQGEVEEALVQIWQELLGVERVGRRDNFWELGGHSLLAMQMMVRIRSSLSIEMPMTMLFEFPTVELLSAQLDDLRHARLLNEIARGRDDIEELLQRVASMPESKVQELMRELRIGGRS